MTHPFHPCAATLGHLDAARNAAGHGASVSSLAVPLGRRSGTVTPRI